MTWSQHLTRSHFDLAGLPGSSGQPGSTRSGHPSSVARSQPGLPSGIIRQTLEPIQKILAWPLCKDDTHTSRSVNSFSVAQSQPFDWLHGSGLLQAAQDSIILNSMIAIIGSSLITISSIIIIIHTIIIIIIIVIINTTMAGIARRTSWAARDSASRLARQAILTVAPAGIGWALADVCEAPSAQRGGRGAEE